MYRVYLDWNVISNFKNFENEKFCRLKSLIVENRDRLVIPFTTAHIEDLKKSLKPGMSDHLLVKDLELLSETSNNEFINWTKGDHTKPLIGHPNSFYFENKESWLNQDSADISRIISSLPSTLDSIGMRQIGESFVSIMKSIPTGDYFPKFEINKSLNITTDYNNMWEYLNVVSDFMSRLLSNKEEYLRIRSNAQNIGISDITKHSANWEADEVFENIDNILKSLGITQTTSEMTEYVVNQFNKGERSIYTEFTTLYLLLDILGYKSDKLSKPSNNFTNITTDSMHAFYGGHCEFIVTDDKNLASKSKAVFHKLKLPIKVFTSQAFVDSFESLIPDKYKSILEFVSDLGNILCDDNFQENFELSNGLVSQIYQIPVLTFDFFNYAIQTYYPEYNVTEIVFRRAFQNYSRFVFHREVDMLISYVMTSCGYDITEATIDEVRNIISKEDGIYLVLNNELLKIALANDDYKVKLIVMIDYSKVKN